MLNFRTIASLIVVLSISLIVVGCDVKTTVTVPDMPGNLIPNGNFEKVTMSKRPEGFSFSFDTGGSTIESDDTRSRSGAYSVKLVSDLSGDGRPAIAKGVPVESGATYRASVWYQLGDDINFEQHDDGRLLRLRFIARYKDDDDKTVKQDWKQAWFVDVGADLDAFTQSQNGHVSPKLPVVADDEWRELAVIIKFPADVIVHSMDVDVHNFKSGGSIWIDDLSLIEM